MKFWGIPGSHRAARTEPPLRDSHRAIQVARLEAEMPVPADGVYATVMRVRSQVVRARCVRKNSVSFAMARVTYSSLSYIATCVAPSIQHSSLGSWAFQKASAVI